MRIGLSVVAIALLLGACGARLDDSHTGGKTSWLSACDTDSDCSDLSDAICASRVCTTACQSQCSVDQTSCVNLWTNGDVGDDVARVCLPQCDRDADCSTFGTNFGCESNVCVLESARVSSSDDLPEERDMDASALSDADPASDVELVWPTRDLAGIVLLDNADDGNNTPLEDVASTPHPNLYGFWYTYSDFATCMGNEDPNPDMEAILEPSEGSMLMTTPYNTMGLSPPPEVLVNAPNNTHGIRVTGSGHEYFGAGLGYKFDGAYFSDFPGIDLQAAGYTGLRFWAYSPVTMDFIVKLEDAYSTPEAGLCVPRGPYPECKGDENCQNAPSTQDLVNLTAGPAWQLYELYFAQVEDDPTTPALERGPLQRSNWAGSDVDGNPMKDIPPTPNRIFKLAFQTAQAEGEGTFDLVIDNVGFIQANGPEDNAQGRFGPE